MIDDKIKISPRRGYPIESKIQKDFFVVVVPLSVNAAEKVGTDSQIQPAAKFIYRKTALRKRNNILSKICAKVNMLVDFKSASNEPLGSFTVVKIAPVHKEKSVNRSAVEGGELKLVARKPVFAFADNNSVVNFEIFREVFGSALDVGFKEFPAFCSKPKRAEFRPERL